MGQQAALVMPDVFAACAVTGGVIKGLDCRKASSDLTGCRQLKPDMRFRFGLCLVSMTQEGET